MTPSDPPPANNDTATAGDREYTVVARRYRPQSFADLVGQQSVIQALSNAIRSHRVAHAYLFTGARGVGKTSTARVLAKALNCEQGTSTEPCNQCETCKSISIGQDVDVIEIDGASNRGIDEIRTLRQNANVRPSRSRYKIYIIDEVHMLTREAFNALLKTLEEPPEHVKFFFCTTEPEKIPITILSRCQRFDFAGIRTTRIAERLAQIAASENATVEPEAMQALARRAAGSMRDAQSLLDQLLAFGGETITASDVHQMLGTASDERIGSMVDCFVSNNPQKILAEIEASVEEGVDLGQLVDQLLGYLRDAMVAASGGSTESFLFSSPDQFQRVQEQAKELGLDSILNMMQLLSETKTKLRFTTQTRVLVELSLVKLCRIEHLTRLPELIRRLEANVGLNSSNPPKATPPIKPNSSPAQSSSAGETSTSQKPAPLKKNEIEPETDQPEQQENQKNLGPLCEENLTEVWQEVLKSLGDMTSQQASLCSRIAIAAPNRLEIHFPARYHFPKRYCERPDQQLRLQKALRELTGQEVQVQFFLESESEEEAAVSSEQKPANPVASIENHPLIQRTRELFRAEIVRAQLPETSSGS
ncbi:DNA polymerase III, subunit gamma and tau [Planctomycetales bacterium 10988]|nr:DNA polymerase III, subunit gamma and tau [Planctomycetales bacterium 10988]